MGTGQPREHKPRIAADERYERKVSYLDLPRGH